MRTYVILAIAAGVFILALGILGTLLIERALTHQSALCHSNPGRCPFALLRKTDSFSRA